MDSKATAEPPLAAAVRLRAVWDGNLAMQKSLLESQTEASLDGILVVDTEGNILLHNQRFLELWQVCAEFIGTRSDERLLSAVRAHVTDPAEFAERIDYLYRHPNETSREEVRLRDGRVFDRYSAPIKGEGAAPYGRVWFFRDISEQYRSRVQIEALAQSLSKHVAELEKTQLELQHAVRARDEFLSIASHELKTPVTALHLQIQNIMRAVGRSDKKVTEAWLLAKVVRSEPQLMRLSRLIDNLLDVSRITAGRLEFEREPVDLSAVTEETAERLREEAVRVGSTIVVQAQPKIIGYWDRLRLEQVITNLMTNAIKYGGGRPIEVQVTCAAQRAFVTVKDLGIGISAENQARIFERFERAVSDRQYGGLGLGLWITRQIVEALSGRITVESNFGAGSRFTVELPQTPCPPAGSSGSPPP
jgi:signal transduction histidine kinase